MCNFAQNISPIHSKLYTFKQKWNFKNSWDFKAHDIFKMFPWWFAGIILCMRRVNERRHYNVTSSLIGWAHTQNSPWVCVRNFGTGVLRCSTFWRMGSCLENRVLNTLRPRQNGRCFADDIFKCIFLNENVWIPIEISLKFVPKGPINYTPALV